MIQTGVAEINNIYSREHEDSGQLKSWKRVTQSKEKIIYMKRSGVIKRVVLSSDIMEIYLDLGCSMLQLGAFYYIQLDFFNPAKMTKFLAINKH